MIVLDVKEGEDDSKMLLLIYLGAICCKVVGYNECCHFFLFCFFHADLELETNYILCVVIIFSSFPLLFYKAGASFSQESLDPFCYVI